MPCFFTIDAFAVAAPADPLPSSNLSVSFGRECRLISDKQFARGYASFRERLAEPGLRAFWLDQRDGAKAAAPGYAAFIDGLVNWPLYRDKPRQ